MNVSHREYKEFVLSNPEFKEWSKYSTMKYIEHLRKFDTMEPVIFPVVHPPVSKPNLSKNQLREQAYQVARKQYPTHSKPNVCEKCEEAEPTERHHLVPVTDLILKGTHLIPEKHECIWVCHTCHEILEGKTFPNVNHHHTLG